jgi:hypothetical protein
MMMAALRGGFFSLWSFGARGHAQPHQTGAKLGRQSPTRNVVPLQKPRMHEEPNAQPDGTNAIVRCRHSTSFPHTLRAVSQQWPTWTFQVVIA